MDFDKKTLKIAAKITAGTLSESGKLDSESAKETVGFLKTVYKGVFVLPILLYYDGDLNMIQCILRFPVDFLLILGLSACIIIDRWLCTNHNFYKVLPHNADYVVGLVM